MPSINVASCRFFTCAVFVAGAAIGLVSPPALQADEMRYGEGGSVAAAAGLPPAPVGQAGSSVYVVTSQDIVDSGEVFLVNVLRGLPGVKITELGPNGSRQYVSLRGATPQNTLVFVDGAEANGPGASGNSSFLYTTAYDFGHLLSGDVERVEIIRGGAAAAYGLGANGGVINIITRGAAGQGADATLSYGSNETRRARVGFSAAGEGLKLGFRAAFYETEGVDISSAGPEEADGYENRSLAGNIFSSNAYGEMGIGFTSRHGEADLDVFDAAGFSTELVATGGETADEEAEEVEVNGVQMHDETSLRGYFKSKWDLMGGLKWKHHIQTSHFYGDTAARYDAEDATAASAAAVAAATAAVAAADPTDADAVAEAAADLEAANAAASALTTATADAGRSFSRLSAQYRSTLASGKSRASLLFGYEEETISGQGEDKYFTSLGLKTRLYGFDISATGRLDFNPGEGRDDYSTYHSTIGWKLFGFRFHSSYGYSIYQPSLVHLYDASVGNIDLRPEVARHWDVGFSRTIFGFPIEAVYFSTDTRDTIMLTGDGDARAYANIPGKFLRTGIESHVSWQLTDYMLLRTSYTYLLSNERDRIEVQPDGTSPVVTTELKEARSRIIGGFSLDWDWSDQMSLYISGAYERLREGNKDNYFVLDAKVSYSLSNDMRIYGRIENILDEAYEGATGYSTRDNGQQSFFVGLTADF